MLRCEPNGAAFKRSELMSVPIVSITKRDGRSVVVFKRDGVLEEWAYLDELNEEDRANILNILEAQEMNDLSKLDTKKMLEELRAKATWTANNQEGALKEPYYLFFFRAVDRDGVTRYFDVMRQEDGF